MERAGPSGGLRRHLAGRLREGLSRAWVRQGAWTVVDQALFSGANFVVNVLLARWLAPEAFGAFATAFIVFLVCGTVHAGLLVEPMLVFGSARFARRRRAYLRLLVAAHGRFALAFGAAFGAAAAVAWALGQGVVAGVLGALAVAQGGILLLWLARRACLVARRPALAAAGGAGYLVAVVGGALALQTLGALGAASALLVMAVASLAVAGTLLARLGVPLRRPVADTARFRAEVRAAHWTYGRWAMPTGVLEWVVSSLPFLVVPFVLGVEGNALVRALFNLALPALHAFVAVSAFALPVLVRSRERGQMRAAVRGLAAVSVALALAYYAVLGLAGEGLLAALYGGKYVATAGELWVVGAYPLAVGLGGVFTAALRAQERPRAVFWARIVAVAVGAPATVAGAMVWGVAGALGGGLVVLAAEALALAVAARSPERRAAVDGPRRRRVLMIAFACSPTRGSEHGQGWRFAEAAAAENDVWALVYAGNAAEAAERLAREPVPGLRLVPYAHPFERARHVRGVERGTVAEQVHYYLWQVLAIRTARRIHREVGFDLVHHITFGKCWAPSAGAFVGAPFVLGPVGGGESAPLRFWPAFSAYGVFYEACRSAGRWLAHLDPLVRHGARRSAVAFGSTEDTARVLRRLGARRATAQPSIGLTDGEVARLGALPPSPAGPLRVLMSGRLLHWKGFDLGLRALAASGLTDATVDVLGDGPEAGRLRALAARLGIADRVTFHGLLPRDRALDLLAGANVLLHPSLHDSGGFVTLEALAAGRAVVALDIGGPGVQLTPESGVAVAARSPAQAVADLADALRRLAADPDWRARLGDGAKARIDSALRVHHVAANVLAAYAEVAPMAPEPAPSEPAPDAAGPPSEPAPGSSDGSTHPLARVGLSGRSGGRAR